MSEYTLTKEECLKIGGHCYETEFCSCGNPPTYYRSCIHCGHKQKRKSVTEENLWRDDK